MKKIYNLLIIIIFLPLLYSCGYTPIFSSQNVEIKFISQAYEGDVSLGADIYSKLNNLLIPSPGAKEVSIIIKTLKNKETRSKSKTGEEIEYKITMNSVIKIIDVMSDTILLNKKIILSENYKVQDTSFESETLENKTVNNLIDRISQNLLLSVSQLL